jgi:tetratricopeptide (TPR) repeat protein
MLNLNFMMLHRKDDQEKDELQFLVNLEAAVEALLSKRKLVKALECASHVLTLHEDFYGAKSESYTNFLKGLAGQVFQGAVRCLEVNEGTHALTALKLLEEMLVSQQDIEPYVTEVCELYNQLACSYKRQDRLALTKSYLNKALQLSRDYTRAPIDRASLHLNMCAVLSCLHKHDEAARFGNRAVHYAQEELVNLKLVGETGSTQKVTLLAVAYHNLAVEEEHLKNYDSALEWYNKAVTFMETHGDQSSLLEEFRRSAAAAYKAFLKHKHQMSVRTRSTVNIKRRESGVRRTDSGIGLVKRVNRLLTSMTSLKTRRSSERRDVQSPITAYASTSRRASSTKLNSVEFDSRFPLETKPDTFEAHRMQKRKRGEAASPKPTSQTHSRYSSIFSDQVLGDYRAKHMPMSRKETVLLDSETEADIKELEGMGLLDQTTPQDERSSALPHLPFRNVEDAAEGWRVADTSIKVPQVPQSRNPGAFEVRGDSRKQVETRLHEFKDSASSRIGINQVAESRSQVRSQESSAQQAPMQGPRSKQAEAPINQQSTELLSKQQPTSSKAAVEVTASSPQQASEESKQDKELEQAVLKIQALTRGRNARKQLSMKKTEQEESKSPTPTQPVVEEASATTSPLLKYQGEVRLSSSVVAVVTVADLPRKQQLHVVATSQGRTWELFVEASDPAFKLQMTELTSRLILNDRSLLVLRTESARLTDVQVKPGKNLLRANASPRAPALTDSFTQSTPYQPADLGTPKVHSSSQPPTIDCDAASPYSSHKSNKDPPFRENVEGLRSGEVAEASKQRVSTRVASHSIPLVYTPRSVPPTTAFPQTPTSIAKIKLPSLPASQGNVASETQSPGPVEQKETYDLAQYDTDKIALIQSRVRPR